MRKGAPRRGVPFAMIHWADWPQKQSLLIK
jgi:hypothetical protein